MICSTNQSGYFQETIRRKKFDFQRTERDIEERLEDEDRRKNGSRSRTSSPESNDNDSQVDARIEGQYFCFVPFYQLIGKKLIAQVIRVISIIFIDVEF